jgi:heme exporter protein B
MTAALLAVVRRDLLLALRQRGDVVNILLFFFVVVTMVPLGVGPELSVLRMIGAGTVWVAALLASIVSLARIFAQDYADGSLEQMLLAGQPASVIVVGKILAHWLVTGAPMTLAARTLVAALALGTPALSLVGAVGAALTLGLRGSGVLVTLLVLPLMVPVLIFGAAAVDATSGGLSPVADLLLLGGLSLGAAALAPWAIATALRISLE